MRRARPCSERLSKSPQIAPVVEFVRVFGPAVADVGAVVHVGNENVFDTGIDLGLGLFHGLADADDYQDDTGSSGDEPLAVHVLDVFDVNLLWNLALEDDGVVLGEGFERGIIVERKRWNNDSDADLKAAARAPFRFDTGGKLPEKFTYGREHSFLLNADGGIAEARRKFERIDAVAVDDAIQVDVTYVAFFGEF